MRSLTLGIVRLFVKRLGLKIRSQLLFSTRFFLPLSGCRQCLQTANISQWRSITLVKNCLWLEFSLFWHEKENWRKLFLLGLFIHCREEGSLFEALFDLGSSGLRCRGCKIWCREKRRRSWFWNRSTSWEPQGSHRPSLSHLLTWNFAIFLAILTWNFLPWNQHFPSQTYGSSRFLLLTGL